MLRVIRDQRASQGPHGRRQRVLQATAGSAKGQCFILDEGERPGTVAVYKATIRGRVTDWGPVLTIEGTWEQATAKLEAQLAAQEAEA